MIVSYTDSRKCNQVLLPLRDLKTSRRILHVIRYRTGNQCSSINKGNAIEFFLVRVESRATEYWTDCNLKSSCRGSSYTRALQLSYLDPTKACTTHLALSSVRYFLIYWRCSWGDDAQTCKWILNFFQGWNTDRKTTPSSHNELKMSGQQSSGESYRQLEGTPSRDLGRNSLLLVKAEGFCQQFFSLRKRVLCSGYSRSNFFPTGSVLCNRAPKEVKERFLTSSVYPQDRSLIPHQASYWFSSP